MHHVRSDEEFDKKFEGFGMSVVVEFFISYADRISGKEKQEGGGRKAVSLARMRTVQRDCGSDRFAIPLTD
jgi:hypothetical protein